MHSGIFSFVNTYRTRKLLSSRLCDQIDFTGIAITSSTNPISFCTNGSA
jgi:hypothetical protein